MFHPLIDDLSGLTDTEVEEKISELSKKYFRVPAPDMKNQIVIVLDIYKEELAKRRAARWKKEYERRNKDLDKLINID
jgi:hypothetical protein